MKTYTPRALWYVALVFFTMLIFSLPGSQYSSAYLSALFIYFPISVFWIFLSRIFYLGLKAPERTFGFPTEKVGFCIFLLGVLVVLIGTFSENTSIANWGALLIFSGVDWILGYKEGRIISAEGERLGRY